MTAKEIIKRAIRFNNPERIGLSFNSPHINDIYYIAIPGEVLYTPWGSDPALKERVKWFNGEVRLDIFGNIWGRLDDTNRGECIKGVIQEEWMEPEDVPLPALKSEWFEKAASEPEDMGQRYVVGSLPGMPFSIMRTMRGMENFLVDVMLEKERVIELGSRIVDFVEQMVKAYKAVGADGIMFWEDWATQQALLVSPALWREIFKPWYSRLARLCHQNGMHVIMHSCGHIHEIVEDLIEAGIDVLQLDQPGLMGVERLSSEFGGRVAFFCPVDIQKVMPLGDRKLIEEEARRMISLLGRFNGGFIAMDYGAWEDIRVKEEWAQWARDVFIREGNYTHEHNTSA